MGALPGLTGAVYQDRGRVCQSIHKPVDDMATKHESIIHQCVDDNQPHCGRLSATIPIDWNDKTRVLTIGARQGHYPGMETHREFSITMVDPAHGLGEAVSEPSRSIQYDGASEEAHF